MLESVAVAITDTGQRFEVTGVGELVDVDNTIFGLINQMPNDRGTNESNATRH